jgi:hypothetical protein
MTLTTSALSITKVASRNSNKNYLRVGDTYSFYFACFKDLLSFHPVLSKYSLDPCERIATNDIAMYWLYYLH